MSKSRPRDYESEGQYDHASINGRDNGDVFVVSLRGEDGTIEHQIMADRVLAGGGLPDKAVEIVRGTTDYGPVDEAIDACVSHDDGDVVVWLAP